MLQYKSFSGSVTDVDEPKGIVTGYFAHFGSKDSDGDIIHPGAFLKTIAENGPAGKNRIKHLLNHDINRPIGTIKELSEDSTGLKYVSQLWKGIPDADLVLIGAKHENNFEHSIGYKEVAERSQRKADGNHMHELRLFEGSTLTFYGANPNTPLLGVKSLAQMEALYKSLGEELRTGHLSDTTYEFFQKHYDAIGLALKASGINAAHYKGLSATEQKEKKFLIDMIAHHKMALDMARGVADLDRLKEFAQKLIKTQSAEIDQMAKWLKDWFDGSPSGMKSAAPEVSIQPDTPEIKSDQLIAAFRKGLYTTAN